MKYVDLIIFDLDGTLVDSKEDIINAVNHTLKEVGLKKKSIAEISSYIGSGVGDLIKKSLDASKDSIFEKATSMFEEYYKKHFLDHTRLYPGAREILGYFKNKKKVIVTNRKREFAINILKALGIAGYFEDVSGGDNLGCLKPSSCNLEESMRKQNVNKMRTIIVGDMDIDVLAGKEAGIITCAVTYGIGRREDILKAKPDYIIDNLLELKEIIN
jgi:phosphoglycolate phosphatase